jgi:hypothetical protein
MAGGECNNRRGHLQVHVSSAVHHHMSVPACVEIASALLERFGDCRLQPIPRFGWRVAAPRRTIRLLNGDDSTRLRQPPKLSARSPIDGPLPVRRTHTGLANVSMNLAAKFGKLTSDELGGAVLLEAKLGVRVQVAAPGSHFGVNSLDAIGDLHRKRV